MEMSHYPLAAVVAAAQVVRTAMANLGVTEQLQAPAREVVVVPTMARWVPTVRARVAAPAVTVGVVRAVARAVAAMPHRATVVAVVVAMAEVPTLVVRVRKIQSGLRPPTALLPDPAVVEVVVVAAPQIAEQVVTRLLVMVAPVVEGVALPQAPRPATVVMPAKVSSSLPIHPS